MKCILLAFALGACTTSVSNTSTEVRAGAWQSVCVDAESVLGLHHAFFFKVTWTLNDDKTFERVADQYSGKTCAALLTREVWRGTYVMGPFGKDGIATFALTYASAELTAIADGMRDDYNRNSYCGRKDWVLDEPRDIAGALCSNRKIPANDSIGYGKIKIADSSIAVAANDENADGSSPDKRAVNLEGLVFVRVD